MLLDSLIKLNLPGKLIKSENIFKENHKNHESLLCWLKSWYIRQTIIFRISIRTLEAAKRW